jgi:leucyl-tRNA synthetase
MQRNWIGRSEGAKVTFTIEETGDEVEIFCDAAGHAVGRQFFVFSVEHHAGEQLAELARGATSSR